MHDVVVIPEALKTFGVHEIQEVGESCVVSYRNAAGASRARVLSTHLSVIHVRQGSKRISSGSQSVEVSAPGLIVCRPGVHVMTEVLSPSGQPFLSTVCFLGPDLLGKLGAQYGELATGAEESRAMLHGEQLEQGSELQVLLDQLPSCFQGFEGSMIVGLKLRELVFWLARSGAGDLLRAEVAGMRHEPDVKLRAVVEDHGVHGARLEELATLTGRSLSTFKRDFRRLYGESPGKWLRARRLAFSQHLLASGTHNVTQACMSAGFENLSHFIRAFRREFGVTPKQYQLAASAQESSSLKVSIS